MSLHQERDHPEYRGSIVHLDPGTAYEIDLRLQQTGKAVTFTASTWKEEFPIAKTIYLPKASHSNLVVDQSGTAHGYILYAHFEGASAIIDVNNNAETCIEVQPNVSHVILRGLTLKGAKKHGIRLNEGVHDIVIEDCDISGWGTNEAEGWGANYQSAVYAGSNSAVQRIIIQRNKMHHPRSVANSWAEYRIAHATYHPRGPQAVAFYNSKGTHVIRYNEIYSDAKHYFNDALGYGSNYSTQGFPNCDSDIYGNLDAQCPQRPHQSHGFKAFPTFATNNRPGEFALAPGTPGYDAGMVLPNFNDSYHGNGPDIGAFEANSPSMKFGVDASR